MFSSVCLCLKLCVFVVFFREQVIKHSLVHKAFLDFFLFAPDKQRSVGGSQDAVVRLSARASHPFAVFAVMQEMIESIRESVVYMAHTHDGARVAMHCLWHGTAKV